MVAVLDFAAGFTVDKIVRFALSRINGFSLSAKTISDYDTETAKDIFSVTNGTLTEEHQWAFLAIIIRTRGYDSSSYYSSVPYQKYPLSSGINSVPTVGFQKLYGEPIRVAPEDLVDLFPYYYIDVLSCKIAANLCIPLRGDINMKRIMESDFDKSLSAAKVADERLAYRYGYFHE